VRQLTAAAGDGLLGSVGSPGQLETSLNSGYLVGPCNSYLEGPKPIYLAAARAWRRKPPTSSSLADEERVGSLLLSHGGGAIADARSRCSICRRSQPMRDLSTPAASEGTIAALAADFFSASPETTGTAQLTGSAMRQSGLLMQH
jgi:hypothetical protein